MKRLLLALLFTSQVVAAERPVTPADAKALFARFQSLAGSWKAASTKGWTESGTYEVGAKGSVVIHRTHFDGGSNDGMLTTWFLDGERLLMTHYCEARNQPTLVASTIRDDGAIVFRFLSGTNMSSRDTGHMDSCVYRFIDEDHFTSQWTWYAKGKGTWMEEISEQRSR